MAVKKDLSIKYLGVDCINPFFLSSSPVGGNYDMVAIARVSLRLIWSIPYCH